jgi:hypothetical protein
MFAISQALKGLKTSNNKPMENVVYSNVVYSTDIFVLTYRSLRKFAKSDYLFRPVCLLSVRSSAWNNSSLKGQIFLKMLS